VLLRLIVGITAKMLTQVLRELEEDSLIVCTAYLEVPFRVEYHLTKSAEELLPFLGFLISWGEVKMDNLQ